LAATRLWLGWFFGISSKPSPNKSYVTIGADRREFWLRRKTILEASRVFDAARWVLASFAQSKKLVAGPKGLTEKELLKLNIGSASKFAQLSQSRLLRAHPHRQFNNLLTLSRAKDQHNLGLTAMLVDSLF
jgi:hypothetical protein